jgi:putative heme iron utilization protein
MKSHRSLHHEVCSVTNLLAAARAAMRGKLTGHAAAAFLTRWETHAVSYGLYSTSMTTSYINGISRSGDSGSYTYSVNPGSGNKPIT